MAEISSTNVELSAFSHTLGDKDEMEAGRRQRILLVHPGTQHAARLAEELERHGLLYRFWTGWAVSACNKGAAPVSGARKVRIPSEKLRTRRWLEAGAQLLARCGLGGERVWHWRNSLFQRLIPENEIRSVDVVLGFDTSSWIIARRAKHWEKKFILDQSVGHPSSRADALGKAGCDRAVWPEAFAPRWKPLKNAEREEHELADCVVAAGTFTAQTLTGQGVEKAKVKVIPYGVAGEFLQTGEDRMRSNKEGPPVYLFAGYLSARKGLGVLMDAWSQMSLPGASLRLAGGGNAARWLSKEGMPGVVALGQTSRERLIDEMKRADIFVFPSLFEGFGLVLLEAMAAGLPIVTTPNTAGPDLIEDGNEGFIVPAGDVKALREAMEKLGRDPNLAHAMGRRAHEKAKSYTWTRYGEQWAALLMGLSENE